jgi:hypothetical protein
MPCLYLNAFNHSANRVTLKRQKSGWRTRWSAGLPDSSETVE